MWRTVSHSCWRHFFLSLNVAPTEEMIPSVLQDDAMACPSLDSSFRRAHAQFVYTLSFRGSHDLAEGTPSWHALVRFDSGYVIAGMISAFCLWTFHRTDDVGGHASVDDDRYLEFSWCDWRRPLL